MHFIEKTVNGLYSYRIDVDRIYFRTQGRILKKRNTGGHASQGTYVFACQSEIG